MKEIWIDSEQCPGVWAEFISAEFLRRDIAGKEVIIQEWPTAMDHRYRRNEICDARFMDGKSCYRK